MKLKKLFLNLLEKFKNKKEKLNLPTRRLVFVIFILLTITFFISRSSLASLSFFSTDSLNKGLVGHWPLDGEHFNSNANRVDDISGYQNHGTNSGASLTTGIHGGSEGGMDFDGDSDYITLPDLSLNQTQITFSFWVKFNSLTGTLGNGDIIFGSKYWQDNEFSIEQPNYERKLYLVVGQADLAVIQPSFEVGEWVHLVFVYDSDQSNWDDALKVYFNSSPEPLISFGGDINPLVSSSNINISGGTKFNGSLSDVRIYDRLLSESEVKKLYEKHQPKLSTGGLNKKLVGHWPLNPSSGSTARSCKAILDNNKSHGDGIYKIDPDGPGGNDSFEVYCDMTTDGGGWTLVTNIVDTNANNIPDTISDVRSGWTEVSEGNLASFDGANTYDLSYFVGNSNLESFDPSNIKICATKTKLDKRCYSDIIEADDFTYNGYGGGTGITSSNNFLKIAAALSGTVAYGDNISGEHGEFIDEDVDPEFTLFYGDGYTSSSGGHFRQWSGDNANWHVWGFGIAQTNDYTDDREIYNNGSSDSGQLRPYTAGWEVWLRESDANTLADTKDNSPNSNHGEIHGAQIRNHGASFDGVDSYISLSGDSLDQTSNKGSLSLWVRSNSPSSTESIFHTEENRDRAIWTDSGVFYAAQYYDSTGSFEVVSGGNVDTNWHHIVFFWDLLNGNEKLYVDGVLVDSISPLAGTDVSRGSPTLLGGARGADANVPSRDNLNGNISDVKIYDRALSDSEVSDLYNGKDISGAILDMPLNQKTNFKDMSGNNYHGTNNGASIVGEAAYFDGTDASNYISLGNVTGFDDSFTIDFWTYFQRGLRYGTLPETLAGVIHDFNGNSTGYIGLDDNKIYYNLAFSDATHTGYTATFPNIQDSWHHFSITYDQNYIRFYKDGEQVDQIAENGTFNTGGNFTRLGYFTSYWLDGSIKDLKFYKRALSEAEIKSIYNKKEFNNSSVGASTGSLNKGLVLDMPLDKNHEKFGDQLVKNHNFETGDFTDWGPEDTTTISSSIVKEGNYSVKLAADDPIEHVWLDQDVYDVSHGTYVMSGWIYITAASTTNIGTGAYIWYNDGTHGGVGFGNANNSILNEWQRVEEVFTTNFDKTLDRIHLYTPHSHNLDVTFYGDLISLRRLKTADTTPYSNHGDIYGATVGDDYTSFDGTNDYVEVADDDSLDITDSITLSSWVLYNSQKNFQGIFGKGDNYWLLQRYNEIDGFYAQLQGSSNACYAYGSGGLHDNKWYHVVATWQKGDYLRIYYNGVQEGISGNVCNESIISNDQILEIGRNPVENDYYFNGDIANVKIYNRALSKKEVKALFDKERGQFGI